MADQSESLTVKISADAGNATSVLADMDARLRGLEQAFTASHGASQHAAEGLKAHADAAEHGGEKAHEAAEEHGKLTEALKTLGEHSYIAAEGLEALGLEADAGAVRINGLAELIEKLGDAAPELLALGAAIGALSVGFGLLAESVNVAAKAQYELVSIGALVKNQGGEEWQEQTKALGEYAEALSRAGVFEKGEVLSGMREMLAAGVSLNDVIRSQAAAQDLAIAKNESLSEAERQLAEAYDGRLRSFKMLGIVTADEVKAGLPYEDLLKRIEDRMRRSAAAALDTYAGKTKNLANNYDALLDSVGTALLPAMESWVDVLSKAVEAAEPLTDEFAKWVTSQIPAMKAGFEGFGQSIGAIGSEVLPAFIKGLESAISTFDKLGKWFGDHADDIKTFFNVTLGVGAVVALRSVAISLGGVVAGLEAVTVAEAVASLGTTVLITGLVLGAEQLISHWGEFVSAWNSDWEQILGIVESVTAGVLDAMASMTRGISDALSHIPLLGSAADAVRRDATAMSATEFGLLRDANSHTAQAQRERTAPAPLYAGDRTSDNTDTPLPKKTEAPPTHTSDHQIPGTSTAAAGAPYDPGDTREKPQAIGDLSKAHAALAAVLSDESAAYKALKSTVDAHLDSAALDAQKEREKYEAFTTARAGIVGETTAVNENASAVRAARAEYQSSYASYQQSVEALNAVKAGLAGKTKLTNDDKASIKDATEAERKAAEALAASKANLDTHTASLEKHEKALAADTKTTNDFIASQQKLATSLIDAKESAQRAYENDIATHDQSKAEAVKYYADKLATATAANDAFYAQNHALNDKLVKDVNEAQAALGKANSAEANSLSDTAKHATEFYAKSAQEMQGDLAVAGLTTQQKVAYYAQMYASLESLAQQYRTNGDADNYAQQEALAEQAYGKELEAYKSMLDQQREAQKKAHDEEVQDVTDFIDQIVTQHKSMGDILKGVYADILKSFESMAAKMIVDSKGFQGIFGGATAGANGGSGLGGLFSMFTGGGAQGSTPNGTPNNPLHVVIGDAQSSFLSKMTGQSNGVASGGYSAFINSGASSTLAVSAQDAATTLIGGTIGTPSELGANPQASLPGGTQAASSAGYSLAGVMAGLGLGSLAGSALGGLFQGQNDSGIGGQLGGAIGSIGGPIGSAIGAVGGSLLGGLFGSHTTAAQQPDINEPTYGTTMTYGQFLANLQGQSVTAGNATYQPGSQYDTAQGGTDLSAAAVAQIQNALAPGSGASAAEIAAAKALEALTGGSDAPNALNVIGGKNGNLELQSGVTVSAQTLMTDMQALMTSVSNAPAGSTAAVTNATLGQFMANMNGVVSTLAGTQYTPANANNPGLTGTASNQGAQLVNQLASALAPNAGTPSQLLAEAQQLAALEKGDTSANALNITADNNGTLTLGSGATISAQEFYSMVTKFQGDAGSSQSAIPTFSISRDYMGAPNIADMTAAGVTPAQGITLGTGAVVVNVTGSVIGANGIDELTQQIATGLHRSVTGTTPITGRRYTNGGGF